MIIVFVGYYLVITALATLPLRQGRVPRSGEGVDLSFPFSPFRFPFFLIHPLRFARPACLRGTVCWRDVFFSLYSLV